MPLFKHDVGQSVGTVTRLALLLLLIVAACGSDSGDRSPGVGGTEELVAGITASDSGESFTLRHGDETSLRLSSEYLWSEPDVRGEAVELARVDHVQDPGYSEWLVSGERPGTATISSLGTPACAGQHGCPDEPVRFQVTITVAE
jgi:hypothetical protein